MFFAAGRQMLYLGRQFGLLPGMEPAAPYEPPLVRILAGLMFECEDEHFEDEGSSQFDLKCMLCVYHFFCKFYFILVFYDFYFVSQLSAWP